MLDKFLNFNLIYLLMLVLVNIVLCKIKDCLCVIFIAGYGIILKCLILW